MKKIIVLLFALTIMTEIMTAQIMTATTETAKTKPSKINVLTAHAISTDISRLFIAQEELPQFSKRLVLNS